jgi:hypothetical protein
MKKQKIKLGIAWYREDQWSLLKSTASDSGGIENTYEEWFQHASESIKKLENQGVEPVKIVFDVNEFNDWCKRNKKFLDGESRSEYTALLLRRMDKYS